MKLESNIWKYYLYRLIGNFQLFHPVFVPYLVSNGLTMFQIMLLQSVFTGTIILSSIHTGIFADKYGRKYALILSQVLFSFGWLAFGLGTKYFHYIFAEIMCGTSLALFANAGNTFVYDTLNTLKQPKSFKKVMGKINMFNYGSSAISALVAGYVSLISYKFTILFSAIFPLMAVSVCISFKEPKSVSKVVDKYLHFKEAINVVRKNYYLKLLFVVSAFNGATFFAMWMYYQPYFSSLGLGKVGIGYAYFLLMIATGIGALVAHYFEIFLTDSKYVITILTMFILSFAGILVSDTLIGLVFTTLYAFCLGVNEIVFNDLINKRCTKKHRSTIFSFNTLIVFSAAAILSPVFGKLSDIFGLDFVFRIFICLTILALMIFYGGTANET